jgi:hypothetical protein
MFHSRAQGFFTWIVLDSNDKVVNYAPRYQKNLITNAGLNGIAVRPWADSFVACAVGTGNSAPDVTQTTLDTEVARTTDYLSATGANSSSIVGAAFVMRRTFVFPITLPTGTYREAGFSHSTLGTLFSRVLLPNIPIVLGQRLIIQYDLAITLSPSTPSALTNPIRSITSAGSFQYQLIGLKGVNSSGVTYNYDSASPCNEPSDAAAKFFLSKTATAPAALGSSVDRTAVSFEQDLLNVTYVANSFYRIKRASVTRQNAVDTWRSCGAGANSIPALNTGVVHVFNSGFVKGDGTLIMDFRWTWGTSFASSAPRITSLHYWQDEDNLFLYRTNHLLQYFGQTHE